MSSSSGSPFRTVRSQVERLEQQHAALQGDSPLSQTQRDVRNPPESARNFQGPYAATRSNSHLPHMQHADTTFSRSTSTVEHHLALPENNGLFSQTQCETTTSAGSVIELEQRNTGNHGEGPFLHTQRNVTPPSRTPLGFEQQGAASPSGNPFPDTQHDVIILSRSPTSFQQQSGSFDNDSPFLDKQHDTRLPTSPGASLERPFEASCDDSVFPDMQHATSIHITSGPSTESQHGVSYSGNPLVQMQNDMNDSPRSQASLEQQSPVSRHAILSNLSLGDLPNLNSEARGLGRLNASDNPRFPVFGERNSPGVEPSSPEAPEFDSILRIRWSASSEELSYRRNSDWLDIEGDQGLEMISDHSRSGARSGSVSYGQLSVQSSPHIQGIAVEVYDSAHSRAHTPFESVVLSENLLSDVPNSSQLVSSAEITPDVVVSADSSRNVHGLVDNEAQTEFSHLTLAQRIRQGLRASTATDQSFPLYNSGLTINTQSLARSPDRGFSHHGTEHQDATGEVVQVYDRTEASEGATHSHPALERSTAGRTPPLQSLGFGRPSSGRGPRIGTLFAGSSSAETSNTVTDSNGNVTVLRHATPQNAENNEDNDWETDLGSRTVPESNAAYTGLNVAEAGSSLADNSDADSLSPPKQTRSFNSNPFAGRPVLSHPPHPRYTSNPRPLRMNQPGGGVVLLPNYPRTSQPTLNPRGDVAPSLVGLFENAMPRPNINIYRHPDPLGSGHEHPFRSSPPSLTSSRRAQLSSTSPFTSGAVNNSFPRVDGYTRETIQLAGNRPKAEREGKDRRERSEEVRVSSLFSSRRNKTFLLVSQDHRRYELCFLLNISSTPETRDTTHSHPCRELLLLAQYLIYS